MPTFTQLHASTAQYRPFRGGATSRARTNLALGLPETRLDAAEMKRQVALRSATTLGTARVIPTSAVVTLVALAVLVFGALVVRRVGTFAVVRGEIQEGAMIAGGGAHADLVEGVVLGGGNGEEGVESANESDTGDGSGGKVPEHGKEGEGKNGTGAQNDVVDVGREDGMVKDEQDEQAKEAVEEEKAVKMQGDESESVRSERSWPSSEEQDVAGLMPLARQLNFNNRTMLNYFHMHKTGGVTTKVELMNLLSRAENKRMLTKRGQRMGYVETCYETKVTKKGDEKSIEGMWRCDFGKILNMTEEEKAGVDILLGHQYWEKGCDDIFGSKREVRHFSMFRHPLPRKLSFYYHFFVRNMGRDEKSVAKEEIIKFLLGEDLSNEPWLRDAGPNYYASRLLSDGREGFKRHQYTIEKSEREGAMKTAMDRLDVRFVFIGLQVQVEASQCMLRKAVEVLAHAHGIDEMKGTSRLAESREKLNAGEYVWTARKVWNAMNDEERGKFKEVELVDLAIYGKAVERFKRDVEVFGCAGRVKLEEWEEDVYE